MTEPNKQITLPINISLGLGAYTTKLWIGSEQTEVNVLIDTGSSTLAIDLKKYKPEKDQHLRTSVYAQCVVYGSGGWAGPVVHSQVALNHQKTLVLDDAPFAITVSSQQQNFQSADGIWGLAYHHLNKAYDVSEYLTQQPALKSTYPWPFDVQESSTSVAAFKKYLRHYPEHDITPLFTAFEASQITPNVFTLVTHRSIEYVPNLNMSVTDIENEPLNQGQFIIGDSPDVNAGPKHSIRVVHDAYYNTELLSCQVQGFAACTAPPLDKKHSSSFFSNAIIDSGCSFLVLQKKLYTYVMDCLKKTNPEFIHLIKAAVAAFENGEEYINPQFKLTKWPVITLSFTGADGGLIELKIPPEHYWQQHAKSPNNWIFMIMNQLPQWPDQTLCGLPLLNSYVCVFDRSCQKNGLIHFFDKE